MKILKPVKVTPRGDWYRIKSPAELNRALASIDWPKDKPYANFIFPKRALAAIKTDWLKLPRGYMLAVNCIAGGRGLKVPPAPPSLAGIETRPPKDLAEFRRLNRLESKKLLKREGKKAGYSVNNDLAMYEKEIMPKAKALLFYRKGKFSGLAVHFRADIFSVGVRDHLGWHDDFRGFSPAERRSAEYQQTLWLKKTAKRGLSVFWGMDSSAHNKYLLGLGLFSGRIRLERL